jgi:hypothetical protein
MATVNAAESLNDLHEKWIKPSLYARRDFNRPSQVIITQKFTIPAANLIANDIVRLFKFPAAAFLLDWRSTPSDADATLLTIVSGSTNGQAAAGSDRMISAVAGRYVGNSWCVWKTGTAADVAAAGTLKVYCAFALGTINRLSRGLYLRDPEL